MEKKYAFRYHPLELTLVGRFLPIHCVDERSDKYCGGHEQKCPRSYLKKVSLRRIKVLKGG